MCVVLQNTKGIFIHHINQCSRRIPIKKWLINKISKKSSGNPGKNITLSVSISVRAEYIMYMLVEKIHVSNDRP